MAIRRLSRAIILITWGKYARASYHVIGDEIITTEVKEAILCYSLTSGMYETISPYHEILTSDGDISEESKFNTKILGRASTGSGKGVSLEEMVVDSVSMIRPDVEYILTKRQLDSIVERSVEIGAISAHLTSMHALINKLDRNLDEQFEKFDSIKARF
ncbi:MAG: hypothetical protein NTY37_10600 [Methanothrix sp.]|nr:hypothetical protein [Methanothrix sp.]